MRILTITLCLSALACNAKPSPTQPATADQRKQAPDKQVLTVYSGRSALLVEPLLKRFADQRGVELKLRFDKSTAKLANRLVLEGASSPADLFFAQAVGYLTLLGQKGLMKPLSPSLLEQVAADHRSPSGHWVGTSSRLRVMVYSPERIQAPPKTLDELTDPRFKGRVGWAPGNASLHAHVAALRSHWGEERTKAWLTAMKANEPVVYPKNSPQVRAVSSGEIDIGWVNHYYVHKLKAQDSTLKAANASFSPDDPGHLVMLAGIGVPKASKNQALAEELIAFILSDEGQTYFTQTAYEYPARAGIKLHPDVAALSPSTLKIPQSAQTDIAGSLSLLRSLRIQ